MKKIISLLIFGLGFWTAGMAQGVTSQTNEVPKQKFARATFNATKIINMQSTEMVTKGNLQFMVSHHFSNIWNKDAESSQNLGQLLGINSGVAQTYLSFDYSITDYANVGLAAAGSSAYEGFVKFKLIRQQTGKMNIPVTIDWYSMAHINTAKDPMAQNSWQKFSFLNQILIARKFSEHLSVELIPSYIYVNLVPFGPNNTHDIFNIGLAGKYKMSKNINLTFEYARQLNGYSKLLDKNANILSYHPDLLSLGIELNTGGHQFQFYVGSTTNSSNIDQLARNTSSIKDGNFAFGFTMNRSFKLGKK